MVYCLPSPICSVVSKGILWLLSLPCPGWACGRNRCSLLLCSNRSCRYGHLFPEWFFAFHCEYPPGLVPTSARAQCHADCLPRRPFQIFYPVRQPLQVRLPENEILRC